MRRSNYSGTLSISGLNIRGWKPSRAIISKVDAGTTTNVRKKPARMIRLEDGGSPCDWLETSKHKTEGDISHNTTDLKDLSPSCLPVRKEFPYDVKRSYRDSNPFVIAFVYSRYSKPYVLKGGNNDVEYYLRGKEPAVAHVTFWKEKWFKTSIRFYNFKHELNHTDEARIVFGLRKKHAIYTWRDGEKVLIANFRRVPRKWIKQLERYI